MIPIFELKRQYQNIKTEIDTAMRSVAEKGFFTLGYKVREFEQEFADYVDIYHAVGVGSGTDALTISLKAMGVKPGDEVIIPANTYPTAFGVALSGCRIRLADCGPDGNISLTDLENRLSEKTKVVVPVHLYGNPSDVIGIKQLLLKNKLKTLILEDAAQAHGAQILDGSSWRKAGTIGDMGIFSFYPSKNLGAYGDGGMIVTDRSSLAKKSMMLRMYGESDRYHSEMVSGVSRLDELQAAILLVKLKYLDEWNEKRTRIAEHYQKELSGIGDIRFMRNEVTAKSRKKSLFFKPKYLNGYTRSSHHLFVIRTKKRDKLQKYLADHGVGSGVHYPVPVHLTPSFKYLGYRKGDFPEAEAQSQEVLSLPIYPDLTNSETEKVIQTVRKFFAKI